MHDLLDVRRQLEQPLGRFRAALAAVAVQFEAAAWEDGFEREVEDLYRQQVAPALLEVQEALKQLGALPTLLRLTSSERVAGAPGDGTLTVMPADLREPKEADAVL